MTDFNRQSGNAPTQRDEYGDRDELGAYRTAIDVQETTIDQSHQAIRQGADWQGSSSDRRRGYGARSDAGGESTEGANFGNDEPTTE